MSSRRRSFLRPALTGTTFNPDLLVLASEEDGNDRQSSADAKPTHTDNAVPSDQPADDGTDQQLRVGELEREVARLRLEIATLESDRTIMESYMNEEFSARKHAPSPDTSFLVAPPLPATDAATVPLQEHEALKRALQQSQDENGKLATELRTIRTEIAMLEEMVRDVQPVQRVQAERDRLQHENNELRQLLQNQQYTAAPEQDRLEAEIAQLQVENKSLVESRAKFMSSFEQRLAEVETEFDRTLKTLEQEKAALATQLQEAQQKLAKAESERQEAVQSFDYLQAEMDDLRDRNTALERTVDENAQYKASADNMIRTLQKQLNAVDNESYDLRHSQSTQQSASSLPSAALEQTHIASDDHAQQYIRAMETEREGLKARLERSQTQVRILQATVDQLLAAQSPTKDSGNNDVPEPDRRSQTSSASSAHALAAITSPVRHRPTSYLAPGSLRSGNDSHSGRSRESRIPLSPRLARSKSRPRQPLSIDAANANFLDGTIPNSPGQSPTTARSQLPVRAAWSSPKPSQSSEASSSPEPTSSPSGSTGNLHEVAAANRSSSVRSPELRRHKSIASFNTMGVRSSRTAETIASGLPRSKSRDSRIATMHASSSAPPPPPGATPPRTRASTVASTTSTTLTSPVAHKVSAMDWQEYMRLAQNLENQLKQLTHRREMLQAEYARVPIHASAQNRRRKDDLDQMLDEVDKQCGYIRQQLKSMNFL